MILSEQVAYLDRVISSFKDGVAVVDSGLIVNFANDTFVNIIGKASCEIIHSPLSVLLPFIPSKVTSLDQLVNLNGQKDFFQGSFPMSLQFTAIPVPELRISLILVTDLLGRHKEESIFLNQALEVEKAKIRAEQESSKNEAILRSLVFGLVMGDKSNTVMFANQIACDLLGLTLGQVVGRPVSEIIRVTTKEDDDDIIVSDSRSVLTTISADDANRPTTYYMLRGDQGRFPVVINTSSVILNKEPVGTVFVFRDITIEKRMERSKNEFLAIASHQLRTPLGSMKWNLEMLLEGDFGQLSTDSRGVVTEILEANARMVNLVNELLVVSRIEQGRAAGAPQLTDITPIISDAVDELLVLAKKKQVEIIIHDMRNVPQVKLDPKQFREVIENLLSNAVKYTPEKGLVAVSAQLRDNEVVFEVKDNGIGISPKDKDRIFSKFFRADNAIKTDTEGTGLGLYVVKSYVEKWGGRVWFETVLNEGTTFFLTVPVSVDNSKLTK